MALVRVYCGLAATQSAVARGSSCAGLTIAVVDDAGRLMEICDLSDDPSGYAQLGSLFAERSGDGGAGVAVAADSDEHQVTLLLAAAGRPLAIVEDESLDDYAERFGDNDSAGEPEISVSERRAIGLARALQAGALAAAVQSAPRELMALKPVLAAHSALAAGRQGAAVALREVLRELYPAALRAYPDPAAAIPLAILDALPEPGLLGGATATRGQDSVVAADLAAAGLADHETISEAIAALRVAIAEAPRRAGIGKTLTTAVTETIQQAVAAVRACDSGIAALVGLLAERATPVTSSGRRSDTPMPLRAIREPSADTPMWAMREPSADMPMRDPLQRRGRPRPSPVAVDPPRGPSMADPRVPSGMAVAAGPRVSPAAWPSPPPRQPKHTTTGHAQPEQANPPLGDSDAVPVASAPPVPVPSAPPVSAPLSSAPLSSAPLSFIDSRSFVDSRPFVDSAVDDPYPSGQSYSFPSAYPPGGQLTVTPSPEVGPPGSRADWPLNSTGTPGTGSPAKLDVPGHSVGYPVTSLPPTVLGRRPADPPPVPHQRDGRVPPPWQANDLPAEPPSLRLVEPDPLVAPALPDDPRAGDRDCLTGPDRTEAEPTPPLRLVESNGVPARPISAPPVPDERDGDLLIFAQARSAWFTGHLDQADTAPDWTNPADLGWQAAERAASPVFGEETSVGLPRRVPQANLVPGSPLPPASDRSLRIVRDPAAMAAHTTGYFRGSRRGEEVRGFAVGGRPGREAAGGWDFSREGWDADQDERDYGYRSASNR